MYISEIWRYPIKSMRGERIPSSTVLLSGLASDRQIVCVSKTRGKLITARTHPRLLGLQACVRGNAINVSGFPWQSAAASELVSDAASERVFLADLETDTRRFDVLPLLVATDGALAQLELDSRRFRPNIVIGNVPGNSERDWPGFQIQLGPVRIRAAQLRMRCVMTTFNPDTLKQDRSVLKKIVSQNGGTLALDCAVIQAGFVQEGDLVSVFESQAHQLKGEIS